MAEERPYCRDAGGDDPEMKFYTEMKRASVYVEHMSQSEDRIGITLPNYPQELCPLNIIVRQRYTIPVIFWWNLQVISAAARSRRPTVLMIAVTPVLQAY